MFRIAKLRDLVLDIASEPLQHLAHGILDILEEDLVGIIDRVDVKMNEKVAEINSTVDEKVKDLDAKVEKILPKAKKKAGK